MRPTHDEFGSRLPTEEQPDENPQDGGIAIARATSSSVATLSDEAITAVVVIAAVVEVTPDEHEKMVASQAGLL